MNRRRLINRSTGRVLASRAEIARGMGWLRGLIGQNVPPDYALGLPSCDWVHTWGMRVPVDLLFCEKTGRVLRVLRGVPPRRVLPRVRGASITWEMAAGQTGNGRVSPGDVVVFE